MRLRVCILLVTSLTIKVSAMEPTTLPSWHTMPPEIQSKIFSLIQASSNWDYALNALRTLRTVSKKFKERIDGPYTLSFFREVYAKENKKEAEENLAIAAERNNIDKLKAWIKAGVTINALARYGSTALIQAITANVSPAPIVEVLLHAHADPNIKNVNQGFPLLIAIYNSQADVVELLLKHNADPNLLTSMKISPLSIAKEKGNAEIIKLLKAYGAQE